MKQQTLAMAANQNAPYERYSSPTRRDQFLATMGRTVPLAALCSVVESHYPKAGNGRPPVGLERMLRMYFAQHWFNLADEDCEDALLDSTAQLRRDRLRPRACARWDHAVEVPPPAGEARPRSRPVRQGRRGPAGAGHESRHPHRRERDDHRNRPTVAGIDDALAQMSTRGRSNPNATRQV